MTLTHIFEVALAVIGSFGGTAVILVGLASWLGKVWQGRMLEKEKAEFAKLHEAYKSYLKDPSGQQQDALMRRREVYSQLVTTMRVFLVDNGLNATPQEREASKRAFLAAYDRAYL